MKSLNKSIGVKGEILAEKFLKNKGYIILEKNFRCKLGEIDIIAKDNDYICFIEVKSRTTLIFGTPKESVTKTKQNKIIRVANYFILKNHLEKYNFRFDVVEVFFDNNNSKITLIKNAFIL